MVVNGAGGDTYDLLPGIYNQVINVNGGATVRVAPGIYVLNSSWNLNSALSPYVSAGCAGRAWYEPHGSLILNDVTRMDAPCVAAATIIVNEDVQLDVGTSR